MARITELVLVASLVALAVAGAYDTIKGKFLQLGVLGRWLIIGAVLLIACLLVYFDAALPNFEATRFQIPIPVPALNPNRDKHSRPGAAVHHIWMVDGRVLDGKFVAARGEGKSVSRLGFG